MNNAVDEERQAHTNMSNTIAAKQKNKPGVAGEAISCTAPRMSESSRNREETEMGAQMVHHGSDFIL
jgi:hypothetical protein